MLLLPVGQVLRVEYPQTPPRVLIIPQSINPCRNKKFKMNLKAILEEGEKHAKRVMEINPSKINDNLVFPESPGVYLICRNKKAIYIGQSSNLRDRFKKHLSSSQSTKGSTFRRILVRKYGIEPQNTKEWIMENYGISFIEIDDLDMCKFVESLLISYFGIKNKDLLNS